MEESGREQRYNAARSSQPFIFLCSVSNLWRHQIGFIDDNKKDTILKRDKRHINGIILKGELSQLCQTWASDWWASASRAATVATPFNTVAVFSHTGVKALQWPHQGAKNSTKTTPLEFKTCDVSKICQKFVSFMSYWEL